MNRIGILGVFLSLCAVDQAAAACIKLNGSGVSGQVEAHRISPKSSDIARYVRLTPGNATVDIQVVDRGQPTANCSGDQRGLEFSIAWTKDGPQYPCRADDEEGPALTLHCRMTADRRGKYFVRMRNPGCSTITYELRCRNGHVAPR